MSLIVGGAATITGRMPSVVDTKQVKSVGEHFVCAALARRGWAPALTRDGLARTDILAVQTDGSGRQIQVQVKATTYDSWPIGSKSQALAVNDSEWFVLVQLDPEPSGGVRCFVVPRNHVTAGVWIEHQSWLTDPSVPDGRRNTPLANARTQLRVYEGYAERWDLLVASTDAADVLLPREFRGLAELDRVGLPPGHPWQDELPHW